VASALRRAVRRPRIVVPLAVVIVLAAGAGAWAATRSGGSTTGATTTTSLVAATTGTIAETLSASGTVANATTSTLSFSSTGTVTAVHVKVGDTVTKGEVLATVDSTSLADAVAQQQATVASQQATVDGDTGASSEQLAADQATLAADQSQLAQDEADLADATLTSPIAGTVTVEGYTVGDQVGGSSSGGAATGGAAGSTNDATGTTGTTGTASTSADDIEVVSTGSFVADVTVDDTEVGELAVGDEVMLTQTSSTSSSTTGGFGGFGGGGFGGGGGLGGGTGGTTAGTGTTATSGNSSGSTTVNATPFFGTVASVSLTPSTSSSVASYPVVIDVTGTPAKLLAGADVTATITYKALANVVEVPTAAVHTTGGASYVLVSRNGKVTRATVTTGAASDGETQVVTGITSGEMVQETTLSRAVGAGGRTRGGFGGAGGFPGGGG
jgi:macrolide-specific efflux system membrane fusion protein